MNVHFCLPVLISKCHLINETLDNYEYIGIECASFDWRRWNKRNYVSASENKTSRDWNISRRNNEIYEKYEWNGKWKERLNGSKCKKRFIAWIFDK